MTESEAISALKAIETETINQFNSRLNQAIAETLLGTVSKAYGALKAAETEQIAETGLAELAWVCKQQGLTREQLVERPEKDFEDEYFYTMPFDKVFSRRK